MARAGGINSLLGKAWPLLVPCVSVVVLALIVAGGSNVLERVVILALINLVVVLALYMFTGLTGVFSFGQPAFMAIGAYTAGVTTVDPTTKPFLLPNLPSFLATTNLDPVVATLLGGLVAAVFAALLAIPLMRLSGISASLITLGVLFIVYTIARQWIAFTNGTAGLSGIDTTLTVEDAVIWAVVAMVATYLFQQSKIGLQLRATREDEVSAASVGIGVARKRGVAFVLSAFFMGIAGGMYAAFIGGLTPDAFFLPLVFLSIAMLVVGGRTSFAGAVLGTVLISALSETLRRVEASVDRPGMSQVVLGLVMLLILVRRPDGLMGGHEVTWPFRRRGRDPDQSPGTGALVPADAPGPTLSPSD